MTTLTDFLLARIAEDEGFARRGGIKGEEWTAGDESWGAPAVGVVDSYEIVVYDEGRPTVEQAAHIARHDPARVLARCEADRRIVEEVDVEVGHGPAIDWLLRLLALPYADHPDYRQEWKP